MSEINGEVDYSFSMTTHEVLKKIEVILNESEALRARGGLAAEAREIARVWQERHESDSDWPLAVARRRAQGEVLQYLLGVQYFYEHEYRVREGVLIPRPETEILVDTLVKRLNLDHDECLGFEFGVGSGVISIELLSRFSGLKVVGCEVSSIARDVAQENALQILGDLKRFSILDGSHVDPMQSLRGWTAANGRRADFLVSNPPYLLKDSREVDTDVISHEPDEALFARESDGLDYYRHFVESAGELLTANGWIAVEIAHERAMETRELFEGSGWAVTLINDLTGRPRVLMANRQSAE